MRLRDHPQYNYVNPILDLRMGNLPLVYDAKARPVYVCDRYDDMIWSAYWEIGGTLYYLHHRFADNNYLARYHFHDVYPLEGKFLAAIQERLADREKAGQEAREKYTELDFPAYQRWLQKRWPKPCWYAWDGKTFEKRELVHPMGVFLQMYPEYWKIEMEDVFDDFELMPWYYHKHLYVEDAMSWLDEDGSYSVKYSFPTAPIVW